MNLPSGGVVLDAGCGSGRALPYLREAVGREGLVLALDLTWEMLVEARRRGRDSVAQLVQADLAALPLRRASLDAVFAAGLLPHLADPGVALLELARVARPSCTLALFHPVSSAELARRHGSAARIEALLSPDGLSGRLGEAGWLLARVQDAEDGYLAIASRRPP